MKFAGQPLSITEKGGRVVLVEIIPEFERVRVVLDYESK